VEPKASVMSEWERTGPLRGRKVRSTPGNEYSRIGGARQRGISGAAVLGSAQKQLCKSVDKECYAGSGSIPSAARYSANLCTGLAKRRIVRRA